MDTRLDCEIVRDLLPSYVDGLTSGVTNQAVEAHLEGCGDCSEILKRMKEPERQDKPPVAEVDYLKKVRRRAGRTAVLCAACAALLVIALLCIRLFAFGNEAGPTAVNYSTSVSGNTIYFNGSLMDSGNGVSRVSFTEDNGVVSISLYTAPKTFLNSSEFSEKYEVSGTVKEIRFDGLIVWENGTEISRTASLLYASKNPYIGDMSSNGRIATILGVSNQFGNYTNELQTSAEPYGWTLILSEPVSADVEADARNIMMADSYAMLATINNLGYVTWEYQTESGTQNYTITTEDASKFAGRDIKACAETASDLQALMQSLSIKWSGVRETLQEDGTFRISVSNRSDADIYGFVIRYYLDGKPLGTQGGLNADNSSLTRNDTIEFEFMPEDFPEGTGAIDLSGFSFDLAVVGKDGKETPVCENLSVSAKYAWTFYFTLNGDYEKGFVLNEG